MAQTLIRFDIPVTHRDGRSYIAMACGRERDNGQWEAWLEFENVESGEVLRSQRETTQPNQKDAVYWATGLTPVYLEGALDRILHPPRNQRGRKLCRRHVSTALHHTHAWTSRIASRFSTRFPCTKRVPICWLRS